MPDQIYIGNFRKGQIDETTAFNIDNDSFPYLFNFYSWRGRVKRKRGTVKLGRLTRQLVNKNLGNTGAGVTTITFTNIFTTLGLTSQPGAVIVPGSVGIGIGSPDTSIFIDNGNGTFTVSGLGVSVGSSINYGTGNIVLQFSAPLTGGSTILMTTINYYPGLPVMGLRDFTSPTGISNYPLLISFDTTYAYQCSQNDVNASFYSVSYYKSTGNPIIWTGQDYQQFWSTNYPSTTTNQSGAFWATNNVAGFHFANATYTSGTGTTNVTMNLKSGGFNLTTLVVGDKLWTNEWTGTINQQVGNITTNSDSANGNYVVTFSSSVTVSGTGIVQILTNLIPNQDGIRWYDGDMTGGTGIPTSNVTGWVNFSPPLTATSVSINGLESKLYYIVGALAIVPFKDRILFFSPYVQSSSDALPIQLQDTVIWSWNGTPFYNSIVPNNQTFVVNSYYVDQTGLGGYLSAGISQPIQTVTNNEDVLLIGFGGNGRKTRFAYTGNDIQPFLFYNINSELPSTSTFSSVVLDKGAIDIGSFGICITDQQSAQRIDLDIPNSVFQIQKNNNGAQRVNAIRDYLNEWITFTYPVDDSPWRFPTQSFFFNYRDNTWAVFYENYTTKGNYRANDTVTWSTLTYANWGEWTDPWNTGKQTEYEIQVIAGNPQGYVMVQGVGTGEELSGSISQLSDDGNGNTQITSYNHCLSSLNPNTSTSDFIFIQGCLVTDPLLINDESYKVLRIIDADNFVINLAYTDNDYVGGGEFKRLSHPVLQTKQFPFYWQQGRQVRIGVQRYLLDATDNGQVTLNILLSQDNETPWNNSINAGVPNGLEYSQILYTCIEGTNLGLTPANTSLQTLVGSGMNQIWHRVNTSLQGDTFQIELTLSDDQMLNEEYATDEIVLHGMQFTVSQGPMVS
jgi:hypothetical protein